MYALKNKSAIFGQTFVGQFKELGIGNNNLVIDVDEKRTMVKSDQVRVYTFREDESEASLKFSYSR